MTTLEEIKQISKKEMNLNAKIFENILDQNPSEELLERMGDQTLDSFSQQRMSKFQGEDSVYGIFCTYEQIAHVSKLIRASLFYKMALRKGQLQKQEFLPCSEKIRQRRIRVRKLYLQGLKQKIIAQKLGISKSTIEKDLKALQS